MAKMTGLARITRFFGLRKSIVGLLSMAVMVGMGERMAERFLPLYLIALGGGPIAVGLLNALDNLMSALYSFPAGYVSDRLGTKRALIVFNLVAMAGFLLVIFLQFWWAVIIGALFFLSWTSLSLPATMSLVARALPPNKRIMGVTMHSFVRRIPMALGPVIGGACIGRWGVADGVRVAFAVAFVMAGVALGLQQLLIAPDAPGDKGRHVAEKNPLKVMHLMCPALRDLLVADILVRFCEQIPYAFVVIWAVEKIREPITAFQFGVLTSIEMGAAMLIYIPVAYLADRGRKKPFVVMTFVFFTLFPLALLFCHSFALLVCAFVLRGLKEFGEPTRKALIMELAPEGRKATMFGLYYLLRDVVVAGAAFCGAFLWMISPATNFLVAFGFGVTGTLWFALRGRDVGRMKAEG